MKQDIQQVTVAELFLYGGDVEFELKNSLGKVLNLPDGLSVKTIDVLQGYYRDIINDIFNNTLNNEITLIVNITADGATYTVVDGIKRLHAIYSFLYCLISLVEPGAIYFNSLNKEYQDKITNFKFEAVIIELKSGEKIEDDRLISIYNFSHPGREIQTERYNVTLTTDQLKSLCKDAWKLGGDEIFEEIFSFQRTEPLNFDEWFSENVENNPNLQIS